MGWIRCTYTTSIFGHVGLYAPARDRRCDSRRSPVDWSLGSGFLVRASKLDWVDALAQAIRCIGHPEPSRESPLEEEPVITSSAAVRIHFRPFGTTKDICLSVVGRGCNFSPSAAPVFPSLACFVFFGRAFLRAGWQALISIWFRNLGPANVKYGFQEDR